MRPSVRALQITRPPNRSKGAISVEFDEVIADQYAEPTAELTAGDGNFSCRRARNGRGSVVELRVARMPSPSTVWKPQDR
jgi:hypothetical protein